MPAFNLDDYETVADRVARFWSDHPGGRIETAAVTGLCDGERWVFVARVYREHGDQVAAATGYAEETVGSSPVNRSAALENCETSAVGRALANLGYSTSKRASREEMAKVTAPTDPVRVLPEVVNDAKRRVMVLCGGDRDVAAGLWAATLEEAGLVADPATVDELNAILDLLRPREERRDETADPFAGIADQGGTG